MNYAINYYEAIGSYTSFLAGISYQYMAIINSKNVYKFDKDTNLVFFVFTMILTEIAMVMAIHVTFGSIV